MSTPTNTASAFVPGHVTLFFSPSWHDDPRQSGSIGAGITLSDGVTVEVTTARETTIELNSSPVAIDPVERVLDALSHPARVSAETPLPVGAGFGVSGALALGTALAANHVYELGHSENELITTAHTAEVEAGTGLGDVVAQARGGIPIRLAPGAPGYGQLDGIPAVATIEYLSFGGLETADILATDDHALQPAGEAGLQELRANPTLPTLFNAGWTFATTTGLATSPVTDVVEAVQAEGALASMAMLGRTVIALGSALTEAGYDATACETHPPGATLQ